jgi:chromosome partitioning protein
MKGVWVVGNQKGGVGKSTLAVNLAAMANSRGLKPCIYDADPAHSIRDWAEKRAVQEDVENIPVKVADAVVYDKPLAMKKDIDALRESYDLVVVDVAGALSEGTRRAFQQADLIFVPVEPGPVIQADQTFQFILELARPIPVVMAYNKVRPGGDTILRDFVIEAGHEARWRDEYGVTALSTQVTLRNWWKLTFSLGLVLSEGTGEKRDEKAIAELSTLYDEISMVFEQHKQSLVNA